jgi:hypothetical protein
VGSTLSVALGINASGEIAGYYQDGADVMHGFTYDGTSYATLDPPGSYLYTNAIGISDSGEVAGVFGSASSLGFLYDGNSYTRLGPSGSSSTTAHDTSTMRER